MESASLQGCVLHAALGGILAWLATGALLAQSPEALPAYEVASIKLNTSGGNGSSSHGSKGQIVFTNQTLRRLIERAYSVKPFQVSGPDWMESLHFNIVAKYPQETRDGDRSLMLRALLVDRFKLTVHRESKDMPGFALVEAKSGFKLQPVEPGGTSTNSEGGRVRTLTAQKISMPFLADFIARNLGEMVVDKTGINGVYDFKLRWANAEQDPGVNDADAAPSLFTALQESLGLRLQPQKVPVEIIVVDHVERAPSEN